MMWGDLYGYQAAALTVLAIALIGCILISAGNK